MPTFLIVPLVASAVALALLALPKLGLTFPLAQMAAAASGICLAFLPAILGGAIGMFGAWLGVLHLTVKDYELSVFSLAWKFWEHGAFILLSAYPFCVLIVLITLYRFAGDAFRPSEPDQTPSGPAQPPSK